MSEAATRKASVLKKIETKQNKTNSHYLADASLLTSYKAMRFTAATWKVFD